VFRALALLTIYIDHVPGTVFETLTYKNFGFSDAAEAFVLISGMSVALAYGSKFQTGGQLLATLKMCTPSGAEIASRDESGDHVGFHSAPSPSAVHEQSRLLSAAGVSLR